ncbi:MAG: protein translocase subunit SecD, partial [Pseudomonadota bacterium]
MLQFNKWQIGTVIFLVLMGAYFTAPNFFPKDETADSGYVSVPGFAETRVTLGLDLQGGSYFLLEVDTEEALANRISSLQSDVRRTLRTASGGRIGFEAIDVDRENDVLTVPIANAADVDRAFEELRSLSRPLGGALGGGFGRDVRVTQGEGQNIRIAMTDEAKQFYADKAVTDSIEVIRRRIDALGTTEPQIQRQGPNRLVVQVPGNSDSAALQSVINAPGQLTFHMVDSSADPNAPTPPRRIKVVMAEMTNAPGSQLVLVESPEVTGDMVTDASASPDPDGGGFQVNFAFDTRGAKRFADVTRNNVGRQFAIVLDNEIISAPNIQTPITGGSGRITGNFPPDEATQLAVLISAGALPAKLTTIEQRTVGADLGADSVRAGTIALIIGFIAVVIFIVITYGRFGIYADLALLANVLLIAGALSLLGA